jgi:thiopurine S-methyltransferase
MDLAFWQERWTTRQIGFHQPAPNRMLRAHHRCLSLRGGSRVYVPLCGKANDLWFLRQLGVSVVGVEYMPDAICEFFAAHRMTPTVEPHEAFLKFEANHIALLEGDAFDVDVHALDGEVDAIYDRAALVALDPARRHEYVKTCRDVLRPSGNMLLISFEYDQSLVHGPPWSVDEATVRQLFDGWQMQCLERRKAVPSARLQQAGIEMWECAWWLQPPARAS